MNEEKFEYLYRYEDIAYCSGINEWEECVGTEIKVHLLKYPIIKKTPKGVWIYDFGFKKFVLLGARKRFACPTVEDAKESFIRRKKKQISIYKTRIQQAEIALNKALDSNIPIMDNAMKTFHGFYELRQGFASIPKLGIYKR